MPLYFEDQGSGNPTLVFLHGTAAEGSNSFKPQLERFKSAHRIITIDLPGHGRSEHPSGRFTVQETALEVCRSLKMLNGAPFLVIGHSLGGLIALEIARDRPESLTGIVLIDPPMLFPNETAPAMKAVREKFGTLEHLQTVRGVAEQMYFSPSTPRSVRDPVMAAIEAMPADQWTELWDAVQEYDAETALALIQHPALLLYSAVPLNVERLLELNPRMELQRIPNVGHYPQLETPEIVNDSIDRFLNHLAGAASMTATTGSPRYPNERWLPRQEKRTS
jgi:pimeloyl-ACP methyl ester carboxylesterase